MGDVEVRINKILI